MMIDISVENPPLHIRDTLVREWAPTHLVLGETRGMIIRSLLAVKDSQG